MILKIILLVYAYCGPFAGRLSIDSTCVSMCTVVQEKMMYWVKAVTAEIKWTGPLTCNGVLAPAASVLLVVPMTALLIIW